LATAPRMRATIPAAIQYRPARDGEELGHGPDPEQRGTGETDRLPTEDVAGRGLDPLRQLMGDRQPQQHRDERADDRQQLRPDFDPARAR
jgi:hypothetical protein